MFTELVSVGDGNSRFFREEGFDSRPLAANVAEDWLCIKVA